jgi:ABC-type hemin transport system ATPase subunit
MKSILDRSFRYTASFDTDLKRTFARVRRDLRKHAAVVSQATSTAFVHVATIVPKTGVAQQRSEQRAADDVAVGDGHLAARR